MASANERAIPRSKRLRRLCWCEPTNFHTSIRCVLERLYATSQLLSELIGFAPSPNKAVVGSNAFAHEAGIHQHGVLANPLTYEIMTPASVGVPHNRMVLGKHSGRHALAHRLEELGITLDAAELDAAYRRFAELADRRKDIFDQDLLTLAASSRRQPANVPGEAAVVSTTQG